MKRALMIAKEVKEIDTVKELAAAFEGLASIKISQVKDRVLSSEKFFAELWQIYRQLRRDPAKRITSQPRSSKGRAYVAITSVGGLSGDIDQRIVKRLIDEHQSGIEIVVVGQHGRNLLAQRGIRPAKYFPMPESESSPQIGSIASAIAHYGAITVFYQTYVSLTVQKIAQIDLVAAVRELSDKGPDGGEIISSRDYLFEPTLSEIANFMESIMVQIALSQVIFESKLAQYASRFNAMYRANEKAGELGRQLTRQYNRTKRAEKDERLKEIINGIRAS